MIDLIIKNGKIVTHNLEKIADIAVKNGKIFKIGNLVNLKSKKTIDAMGLHILPGAFDTQVHFREPGNTKKENLKTGSLAAVAGGITSVFDMPNNKPSITTRELFMKKLQTAKNRMHCNYAFYFGAEKDNIKEIHHRQPVILNKTDVNHYLNLELSGSNFLKECNNPKLIFHQVSTDVNKPTKNTPSLIQKIKN